MLSEPSEQRQIELKALFEKAPFKHTFAMELTFDINGNAVLDMPYNPSFDHALGGVHGGVIATLLDNAGWFTVAVHTTTWVSTVEFHVRLLEPVANSHLQSRGRLVRMGKRLAVADMDVRTPDGSLVALGSGTFLVTSMPTPLNSDRVAI